jgi:hypothetical protein
MTACIRKADFLDIFDIAYEVIKNRIPHCEVGGAGTPANILTEEFYREWRNHQNPDFVSIMMYAYRVHEKTLTQYIQKAQIVWALRLTFNKLCNFSQV